VNKACRNCHRVLDDDICPICNSSTSSDWSGYIIILDAKRSKMAKKLDIKEEGRYALKVG
jgi:DNA-directed RNA polymerase subunit E"